MISAIFSKTSALANDQRVEETLANRRPFWSAFRASVIPPVPAATGSHHDPANDRRPDRPQRGPQTPGPALGGALHIKELHEFSTLRFGRGHQAFSLPTEGLVSDELVAWDGERFMLTDKGRDSTRGTLM